MTIAFAPASIQIPDELSDHEREELAALTGANVSVHVRAVRLALRNAGIEPTAAELTKFAAQIYIDGFRSRVFARAVAHENQLNLPLPTRH